MHQCSVFTVHTLEVSKRPFNFLEVYIQLDSDSIVNCMINRGSYVTFYAGQHLKPSFPIL